MNAAATLATTCEASVSPETSRLPADLDERLTWLESEVAALQTENARLLDENDRLEAKRDAAQARIAELEWDIRELTRGDDVAERDARICAIREEGLAPLEIAREIGVHRSTVDKVLRKQEAA